ncbi:MAG: glucose-1-phosphate adenylyltransferase [Candidatus Anammoximicrobium sp.]|nr:glucose-1-phosphate adenylyltransferase [Candidatus Anammoximicrobium sp.]
MNDVLTLILAGGRGTRLEPLTIDRSKPAVPFGGMYRIIDFTLSNCINSGLRRVLLLTQYKAASLDRHIDAGWKFLYRELNEFIDVVPPQQRVGDNWYRATADAVYQNIYTLERYNPEYVLILSGDQVYKMDYRPLLAQHMASGAFATLACVPMELEHSREFGVVEVDDAWRVRKFIEKPAHAAPMPDDPQRFLASMGVYVFKAHELYNLLCDDANLTDSTHDFGTDVLPAIIDTHRVQAYPFRDPATGARQYWRDVGTIDAYYEANMDLVAVKPELNLYDQDWPIRTYVPPYPPAKTVFATTKGPERRVGELMESVVGSGSIISGGRVKHSLLSCDVRVNSWAEVEDSILLEGVEIGRHAKVRRAIIDKHVRIPAHVRVGWDRDEDLLHGCTISDSGIVVVPKQFELKLEKIEIRAPT